MNLLNLMGLETDLDTKKPKSPSLIANELIPLLKMKGFIVQKHVAKNGEVTLRLDCGMANVISIRPYKKGKQKLKTMFIINSEQPIDNRTLESHITQYVYGYSSLQLMSLLNKLVENKQNKMKRAGGLSKYNQKMFIKQATETSEKGKWNKNTFI